ncbi:hypothetical protein P7K49_015299, partial [Saguinus oedipus]
MTGDNIQLVVCAANKCGSLKEGSSEELLYAQQAEREAAGMLKRDISSSHPQPELEPPEPSVLGILISSSICLASLRGR